MKHIPTYEGFKNSYSQNINTTQFKNIQKGSTVTYMGSYYIVIDNDGYVLTLKSKDGKNTITINLSQFKTSGMIVENSSNTVSDQELEDAWYHTYKKRFKNEHPGIFKIILKRPPIDSNELNRIWEETYESKFKDDHPKVWAILFGKG